MEAALLALQVTVLVLMVWPLLRLCGNRTFTQAFPRLTATVVAVLATYAGVLLLLVVLAPGLLPFAAMGAAFVVIVERWRALPAWGKKRGLPPGSLALLPLGPWIDDSYYQKQALRYGPVFKASHFFKPMICILGFERGFELLSRHGARLISPVDPFSRFIPRGYIRYMAPEDHLCYRAVLHAALSRDVMQGCTAFVAQQFHHAFQAMAEYCSRGNSNGVQPRQYLGELMFDIHLKMFFGVEPDTPAAARLAELYPVIDHARRRPVTVLRKVSDHDVSEAINAVTAMLEQQADRFRQSLDNNEEPPDCVLAEIVRSNPSFAHDPTVLVNLIFMVRAAGADVAGLLMWLLKMLGDHPLWASRLNQEYTAGGNISGQKANALADCIVSETLRLRQSEYIYRSAKEDIHFGDYLIPKGWMVRICVRETHRQEAVFRNPDNFDPQRMCTRKYSRFEYAPFGLAMHTCLGEHIARMLARIFVVELVTGFDWKTVTDGPIEFRGWHWAPSSRFQIYITPQGGSESST